MARSDRYEDQNWFIRRLRDAYSALVPMYAIRFWNHERSRELDADEDEQSRMSFSDCWCLARGFVNVAQKNYSCIALSEVDYEKDFGLNVVDTEETDC